jgi:beta-fructofuranosidase
MVLLTMIPVNQLVPAAEPDKMVLADSLMEGGLEWIVAGEAFGAVPQKTGLPLSENVAVDLSHGLPGFKNRGGKTTGTLTSTRFEINRDYINFKIAARYYPGDLSKLKPKGFWGDECCINLIVESNAAAYIQNMLTVDGGMVIRSMTGRELTTGEVPRFNWATWDVRRLRGREAWIRIVDNNTASDGMIAIDQMSQSNQPKVDILSNPDEIARANKWTDRAAKHIQRRGFHYKSPTRDVGGMSLTFHEGYYHLFHLFHPYPSIKGGRGDFLPREYFKHARSRDLVYWEDQPIAIWPSQEAGEVACFSGAAVISDDGTPMIFYTSMGPAEAQASEQWVAVGDATLTTWKKIPQNPVVINKPKITGTPYGTDPCVFKEGDKWFMGMGTYTTIEGKDKGSFLLYESRNLIDWTYSGKPFVAETSPWEEADFFRLGDKWVITCEPFGPSQYFTGSFDMEKCKFLPEYHGFLDFAAAAKYDTAKHPKNDHGHFIVCTSTLDDKGRRIVAGISPGGMSLPRVVSLLPDGRLAQKPIPELRQLRREHYNTSDLVLSDSTHRIGQATGDMFEVQAEFEPGTAKEFGLKLRCSEDGSRFVRIACDGEQLEVQGDRTPAALMQNEDSLRLHVFIDQACMEVFANDWVVYTEQISCPAEDQGVEVYASGGTAKLKSIDIWKMDSIW